MEAAVVEPLVRVWEARLVRERRRLGMTGSGRLCLCLVPRVAVGAWVHGVGTITLGTLLLCRFRARGCWEGAEDWCGIEGREKPMRGSSPLF